MEIEPEEKKENTNTEEGTEEIKNEKLNELINEQIDMIKDQEYSSALKHGEFKHEVRQFQKPYDNQQAEQISLMV